MQNPNLWSVTVLNFKVQDLGLIDIFIFSIKNDISDDKSISGWIHTFLDNDNFFVKNHFEILAKK